MRKIKRYSILLFFVFKLFLDFIYQYYVGKQRMYYGYTLDSGLGKTIFMWVALIIYIPLGLRWLYSDRFKDKLLFFLSSIYYIPGLSTYQYTFVKPEMVLSWMFFWWLLFLLGSIPPVTFRPNLFLRKGRLILYCIFLLVIAVVLFYSWKYTGFRMTITFTNEYALRSEERAIVMPTLVQYLYSSAPVLLTMGMAVSAIRKQFLAAFCLLFMQLLYFSIGGHKTVLIMMLIAIGIFFCGKYCKEKYRNLFILLAMVGELIMEVLTQLLHISSLTDNISRRVYYTPQWLNIFYFDYTTQNGFDYFAHGMGRFIGTNSVYTKPLANLISLQYFGTDGNANNGMFSEAYSNLGYFGCLFLPIFLILIIYILGYFVKGKSYTITTLFAFICAYIWGSGNIATGLLTNGLFICAICLFMVNREGVREVE